MRVEGMGRTAHEFHIQTQFVRLCPDQLIQPRVVQTLDELAGPLLGLGIENAMVSS